MRLTATKVRTSIPNRRGFLAGLLASGFVPNVTWADVGSPTLLSAAARSDGRYVLCGIDGGLNVVFQIPLPARGHAAAAHPSRPEAVAFARRPGTFAVVIDCVTGRAKAMLEAPEGRHFYGHGVFSSEGARLFTTENDFETGQGRIGIWDARKGYTRIGDMTSGGIGPHDIKRISGTETLVVANGGIDTHPDTGRTKLNIPTMAPNLAYIDGAAVSDRIEPPRAMHKNSIRHLALGPEGAVAFGMQWQGDGPVQSLVGLHNRGARLVFMQADPEQTRIMDGYIGSIAMSHDGRDIAVTSPRGGVLQRFDAKTAKLSSSTALEDVCGVADIGYSFAVTTGTGLLQHERTRRTEIDLKWDNHLIKV